MNTIIQPTLALKGQRLQPQRTASTAGGQQDVVTLGEAHQALPTKPVFAAEPDANPMQGIPEEAVLWIALAPPWSTPLAAKCGFPTDGISAEEGWQKLSQMGLCSIAKNTDEDGGMVVVMNPQMREAVLEDLRSDPERGQPYITQQMKKIGQAIVNAQLQDTSATISQVSLRWATLAAHADDTDAMGSVLEDKVTFLHRENRRADALRWIEAAEVVNHQLGGGLSQAVGWAKREDKLFESRAVERRRQQHFSDIAEMLEYHKVTPESLAWAALIPMWSADMTIACGFPAFNKKAEFTFEALEHFGMATMEEDIASLNLGVSNSVIDYFNKDEKTGPDFLKREMVNVGTAVVAAHAQGVDVEPTLVKMATLYEKAADPQAAAQFLGERMAAARATNDAEEERAWEFASSKVGRVLGSNWKPQPLPPARG